MSARRTTNITASVRQQILDKARASKRPFNELLQHYAMERFLYRLSKSEYADRFILKGAMDAALASPDPSPKRKRGVPLRAARVPLAARPPVREQDEASF